MCGTARIIAIISMDILFIYLYMMGPRKIQRVEHSFMMCTHMADSVRYYFVLIKLHIKYAKANTECCMLPLCEYYMGWRSSKAVCVIMWKSCAWLFLQIIKFVNNFNNLLGNYDNLAHHFTRHRQNEGLNMCVTWRI